MKLPLLHTKEEQSWGYNALGVFFGVCTFITLIGLLSPVRPYDKDNMIMCFIYFLISVAGMVLSFKVADKLEKEIESHLDKSFIDNISTLTDSDLIKKYNDLLLTLTDIKKYKSTKRIKTNIDIVEAEMLQRFISGMSNVSSDKIPTIRSNILLSESSNVIKTSGGG